MGFGGVAWGRQGAARAARPPLGALAAAVALVAAALALLVPAGTASAANTRVAITDFRWDKPVVNVDLGEWVTWHWVGPDLMHSITGESENAKQWDSDPHTNQPQHELGSTFRVTFDSPGVYAFTCKLHTVVRGEVVVSSKPGDPVSDPDPIPDLKFDNVAPYPEEARLGNSEFRKVTSLHVALDEAGSMDADFFRVLRSGERVFVGWEEWQTHVGYNNVRFGAPGENFTPSPGSFVAVLRATDRQANTSDPVELPFRILKPKPKPKKPKKPKHRRGKGKKGGKQKGGKQKGKQGGKGGKRAGQHVKSS